MNVMIAGMAVMLMLGPTAPPAGSTMTADELAERVMKASGADAWKNVTRVKYTFVIQGRDGSKPPQMRAHDWNVKNHTDTVNLGPKGPVTAKLTEENHTLKRVLTDPRVFSGIGNAYSDEILHRAQLSPIAHSKKLSADEIARLHEATKAILTEWTERLRTETGEGFPENVTAFRPDFAVHGKFKQPCPVCGAPVQRIVYAENETNYCARCQTGGVILADRSLSRLLKKSWPRSIDELGG